MNKEGVKQELEGSWNKMKANYSYKFWCSTWTEVADGSNILILNLFVEVKTWEMIKEIDSWRS